MTGFIAVLNVMLGKRIKDRREEMQYSQQQFADKISVAYQLKRSSISNIERGRQQPPLHIIYEISKVLNLDVQMLLPTYSEVIEEMNSKSYANLDLILDKYNVDEKTLKEIHNAINKFKK